MIDTWTVFRCDKIHPENVRNYLQHYIGRPFDTKFDLDDSTAIYCTELVYLCYRDLCGEGIIHTSLYHGRKIVSTEDCYDVGAGWTKVIGNNASPHR